MGIDVNDFEVVEVYDSTNEFSYGVASLWDDTWKMSSGSLPHTHSDVDAIFNYMTSLTTSVLEEECDQDCMSMDEEEEEEEQEQANDTYMVISIDVKDVPNSTEM